jgi:hypothetical protein
MSLAIVFYTAQGPDARRTKYAVEAARHLRQHVVWPEPIWWHIADDGSGPEHLAAINRAAMEVTPYGHDIGHWTISNSEGRGYGANVNAARDFLQAEGPPEFLLCVEDDWRLVRPLDLDHMLAALRDPEMVDCGMIRLSYIAYTGQLFGLFRWAGDRQWLELRRDSEEGFIFSGNPRLEHWGFQEGFSWCDSAKELTHGKGRGWPGDYELDAAWRLKQRDAGARTEVLWPVDLLPASAGERSYFQHFGAERSFE